MLLSVIIPTRDRPECLRRALISIVAQTLHQDEFEVLVADNGSADQTGEVCHSFKKRINRLEYLRVPEPGLHAGRHAGLKESRGDVLVYADDDIEAFPAWLEGVKETFTDKGVALCGGKNLPRFEHDPPGWLARMWEQGGHGGRLLGYLSILDLGDEKKDISPFFVFGCNFSIRKKVLMEAGGFHPDAMPEDLIRYRGDGETHISKHVMEAGYRAVYNPKASVYHFVPGVRMTEEYFRRRAYMQGISDSYSSIRGERRPGVRGSKGSLSPLDIYRLILRSYKNLSRTRIERVMARSYREGFTYHKRAVEEDKELMNWVLRKDYL